MNGQLALPIYLNHDMTFFDFCWDQNTLLHTQLEQSLLGLSDRILYLWGAPGCGKSHLLQACCNHVALSQPVIYLPLQLLCELGPEIMDGLTSQHVLCIDDVDAIAGDAAWEEALFHLYNRVHDNPPVMLIMASRMAPRTLPIKLPDLHSRLSASLAISMVDIGDEAKIKTLCGHAQKRGLDMPHAVGQFMINRCTRNMHDLHHLLDTLDRASWVAQRKLTIPFVKSVLGI